MPSDLPLDRRDRIARRLTRGEAVVAAQLAAEFAVSEDAIRRDLRALAAAGHCRRVYGGALPLVPGSTPLATRLAAGGDRKAALARAAAGLIKPGDVLFLDSGSTNLALARCLPEDRDLTVATNAVAIAAALVARADIQLIVIGGSVDPLVGGCVDAGAARAVAELNIDRCFLGACAVSAAGIAAFEADDAHFKRALIAASRDCLGLATADKLDARAPHRIAALDRLACLVVEADAPAASLERLERAGAVLFRADAP
jgi:DeoR/GlpR family transcriptional regulator of sugar metabolism